MSLRNTLSLSSSNISSPLSSENSSRSLTSVRSKSNSDDNSPFPSSSQSTKMARATQVTLKLPTYFLSFCNWAMGSMSESIYNTPHQELRVRGTLGGIMSKMLPCAYKGCNVRVHRFCQIDWLHQHDLEVNHNNQFFCQQQNECYQNYVQPHPFLIQEHKESKCMLGSFGMTKNH